MKMSDKMIDLIDEDLIAIETEVNKDYTSDAYIAEKAENIKYLVKNYVSYLKEEKEEKKAIEEVVEIIENEGIMQEVVALLETKGLEVEDLGKSFECIETQRNPRTGDNAEIYKAAYNGTCKYVVIDRWGFGEVYDDYITALETFREYVEDLGEE